MYRACLEFTDLLHRCILGTALLISLLHLLPLLFKLFDSFAKVKLGIWHFRSLRTRGSSPWATVIHVHIRHGS